jgi:endonuclease III
MITDKYTITNQRELQREFWREFPNLCHRRVVRMGDYHCYPTDTRCTWVDWIDGMCKDGIISQALAQRATL